MSAGVACQVHGREWWAVSARWGNHSAFNGYRWTPSEYSEIVCLHPDPAHRKDGSHDGSRWRTKAAYADDLPDVIGWVAPEPEGWVEVPPIPGGHTDVWQCQKPLCGAMVRENGPKPGVPMRWLHDLHFHTEEIP